MSVGAVRAALFDLGAALVVLRSGVDAGEVSADELVPVADWLRRAAKNLVGIADAMVGQANVRQEHINDLDHLLEIPMGGGQ